MSTGQSLEISHVHGNKLKKGENRNMVRRFITYPLFEIEWSEALFIECTQLTVFTQPTRRSRIQLEVPHFLAQIRSVVLATGKYFFAGVPLDFDTYRNSV